MEKYRLSNGKKTKFLAGAVIIAVIALTFALALCFPDRIAECALAALFVLLSLGLISTVRHLKRSLAETLYSYRNVAYLAGILYVSLQLIAILWFFIDSLFAGNFPESKEILLDLLDFPRKFSYFAVPVLSAICLLITVSNAALIRHEGFRAKNLLGVLFGVFYIGGTFLLYYVSDYMTARIFSAGYLAEHTLGVLLDTFLRLFLLLMLCYFECVFAGCAIMGYKAAKHIPAYDKDFIIVLGCSISKKGGLLPLIKGRTNRAIRFAWDQEIATGKKVCYVPSGGQGPDEVMSEGSAMELYLLSHGAENDEVFPERESRNTYENMLFSKQVIDRLKPDAKVAFATTNYHVFRSGIYARQAGLDAEGIASSTKWYFWPNGFLREFFGILAMYRKAHILMAAVCASACLILGLLSYFSGLIV